MNQHDNNEPTEQMNFSTFLDYLAAELETDRSRWSYTATLRDDVGLDSLGHTILLLVLQELGVDLVDIDLEALVTVSDVFEVYKMSPHSPPGNDENRKAEHPLLRVSGDGSARTQLDRVVLGGPIVTLRPVLPSDTEVLFGLATDEETGYRWRLRGRSPSLEEFQKWIHDNTLVQYIMARTNSGVPFGLLQADRPSQAGYVFISALTSPEYIQSGLAFQGIGLFINYLFTNWPFHHIYAETPDFNYRDVFASGVSRLYEEYAHFPDHDFALGRHWDMRVLGITRNHWFTGIGPRFMRSQIPGDTLHRPIYSEEGIGGL